MTLTSRASTAEFVVALGPPQHTPFHKLLGGGGAIIEASAAAAEASMARFEADPDHFGVPKSRLPSRDDDAS